MFDPLYAAGYEWACLLDAAAARDLTVNFNSRNGIIVSDSSGRVLVNYNMAGKRLEVMDLRRISFKVEALSQ